MEGEKCGMNIIMRRYLLLFAMILAGASSACASLGDNDERIEESYGNIVERHLRDDGSVSVLYHKDRYLYFVVFVNRRSVLERYSRVDRADLSEKEIAKFLKANAGPKIMWTRVEANNPKERKFQRSDHKAEATCRKVDGQLTLTVWRPGQAGR
jgi:hypothetical protein